MKLPQEFLDRMKIQLGEEYEEFLQSYNQPRYYGLRVNTLKVSVEEFLSISPFHLEPIPWVKDGFYYREGDQPGKHPFYHAGLYYIQEPSAMLPGAVVDARPGERVLDLCAAPGGKSVQIAAGLAGQGLLVCNDISADRVKALVKNIELCGVKNAVVTNETPGKLAARFGAFFDKIIIDAPCSGEGMFRKDEDAARSWENFKCWRCACMQEEILEEAHKMLRPGGALVYSTCTFAPEEDEGMIQALLDRHPEFELLEIPKVGGITSGRPDWALGNRELAKTARLWPHKLKGEGHFVALLRKKRMEGHKGQEGKEGQEEQEGQEKQEVQEGQERQEEGSLRSSFIKRREGRETLEENRRPGSVQNADEKVLAPFFDFLEENINIENFNINGKNIGRGNTCRDHAGANLEGSFRLNGRNLYLMPLGLPELAGIKTAKFGLYLGELDHGRFEPSHSFILSLKQENLKKKVHFSPDSRELASYLKGETLMMEGPKGWVGVCVDGFPIGWAKQTGDMLKNMYPKGWRKMN